MILDMLAKAQTKHSKENVSAFTHHVFPSSFTVTYFLAFDKVRHFFVCVQLLSRTDSRVRAFVLRKPFDIGCRCAHESRFWFERTVSDSLFDLRRISDRRFQSDGSDSFKLLALHSRYSRTIILLKFTTPSNVHKIHIHERRSLTFREPENIWETGVSQGYLQERRFGRSI